MDAHTHLRGPTGMPSLEGALLLARGLTPIRDGLPAPNSDCFCTVLPSFVTLAAPRDALLFSWLGLKPVKVFLFLSI